MFFLVTTNIRTWELLRFVFAKQFVVIFYETGLIYKIEDKTTFFSSLLSLFLLAVLIVVA